MLVMYFLRGKCRVFKVAHEGGYFSIQCWEVKLIDVADLKAASEFLRDAAEKAD